MIISLPFKTHPNLLNFCLEFELDCSPSYSYSVRYADNANFKLKIHNSVCKKSFIKNSQKQHTQKFLFVKNLRYRIKLHLPNWLITPYSGYSSLSTKHLTREVPLTLPLAFSIFLIGFNTSIIIFHNANIISITFLRVQWSWGKSFIIPCNRGISIHAFYGKKSFFKLMKRINFIAIRAFLAVWLAIF